MTDIFNHVNWATFIFKTGQILPTEYNPLFSHFPFYHILTAEGAILFNIGIRESLFLIMGLVFVVSILFIYLLFTVTLKERLISLVTCFLYANFTIIVFYSAYMVTRVLAFVGFIIFLFLIFKIAETKQYKNRYVILLYPIFLFLITVHPVSIIQFLFILMILIAIVLLFNRKIITTFSPVIVLALMTIAYWLYLSEQFFVDLVDLKTVYSNRQTFSFTEIIPPPDQLFLSLDFMKNNITTGIIIFFVLIGTGFIIHKKNSSYALLFAIFSIPMLVFFVPTPFQSLDLILNTFGFGRFNLYVSPFIAAIMGFGVYVIISIISTLQKYKKIIGIFLVLVCFIVFSYLSLTSYSSSMDSRDLWPNGSTPYFTNSDVNSLDFFNRYIENGATIRSDYFIASYLQTQDVKNFKAYGAKYFDGSMIESLDQIDTYNGFIFYRKGELYKTNILLFKDISITSKSNNINKLEYSLNKISKLYSSRQNELFFR